MPLADDGGPSGYHIFSLEQVCALRSFPGKGEGVTIAGAAPSAAAAKPAAPAAPAAPAPAAKAPVAADDDNSDDSDEDLDLFGELTEVRAGVITY